MQKCYGNKKGFTLIELMMVVVVIGILVIVLVPKYTGVKDTAKTAGVSSNMHVVHVQVQAIIEDYNKNEGKDLEEKLASKVEKLVNPITEEAGKAKKYNSINGLDDQKADSAVVYISGTGSDSIDSSKKYEGIRGCVLVSAYQTADYLEVKLTPFDAQGIAGEPIIINNDSE